MLIMVEAMTINTPITLTPASERICEISDLPVTTGNQESGMTAAISTAVPNLIFCATSMAMNGLFAT